MDWVVQLFQSDSVAHAVLIISLVAACGLALGNIRVSGVGLGIAGVLFAGLVFGHFKMTMNHEVLDFAREFGLILFVYTIGLQVGPGFFGSLRKQGLPLNLMAASIVVLGVLTTLGISKLANVPMPVAVGLFSGGTTNTPSLAAAQQALKDLPGATGDLSKMPGLGYALAYPFGVIGIIITMIAVRSIFRIDPQKEAQAFSKQEEHKPEPLRAINLVVSNPNLEGITLEKVPVANQTGVVVSRVLHDGRVAVAQPETPLEVGDVMLAVGPQDQLDQLRTVVGHDSDVDLRAVPSAITTRWIFVTKPEAMNKKIDELDLVHRHGVAITRVSRSEVEFTPYPDLRLQFGDTVLAVGEEDALKVAAEELGNSIKQLHHPQIIPIFVGIALGVFLGSWPIFLPGMPAAIKLGLAGGPLMVSILLSRIRRVGPLIWHMPPSANATLREVGIVLFLACVGLKAGDQFVATLTQGSGFYWMGLAALITLLPLVIVGFFARIVLKLNFASLCGLLAGSMTDPPALAFANTVTGSDAPSISYATIYPLVMILRVVSAQILVIFFTG